MAVADLCAEHEIPLRQILAKTGPKPPSRPEPMAVAKPPRRLQRKRPLKPLEWTPPGPPPVIKQVPDTATDHAAELVKEVPVAATLRHIDVAVQFSENPSEPSSAAQGKNARARSPRKVKGGGAEPFEGSDAFDGLEREKTRAL